MFIIHWASKFTDATGHGTLPLTREIANAFIEVASKDCIYWLVAVT